MNITLAAQIKLANDVKADLARELARMTEIVEALEHLDTEPSAQNLEYVRRITASRSNRLKGLSDDLRSISNNVYDMGL